jgi:hypothetical protein
MTITITAYLDGKTVGCDYRFTIQQGALSWTAFRTVNGFRRFLRLTGLEVDASRTEYRNNTATGGSKIVLMWCKPRQIEDDRYFWKLADVPADAEHFIGLCNGSYVDCYALREPEKTIIYRPNPNAKNVYRPYDYREAAELFA